MGNAKAEVPIGKQVGTLVVIGTSEKKSGHARYCRVRCTCGNEFDTQLFRVIHDDIHTCRVCANRKAALSQSSAYKNKYPIGTRFGLLTVIGPGISLLTRGAKKPNYYIPMQCDCGAVILERISKLKLGHNHKCRMCDHRDKSNIYSNFRCVDGNQKITRLYRIWSGMLNRCYNPKNKNYKYYGQKNVTVCDEWKHHYEIFSTWAMTHGYRDDLTIDRIDPFGNYTPDNCRWTTWQVQANNKRTNFHQPVQA